MAPRLGSIRRRLTAVIVAITLAALAIGFSIVGVRQVRALRQDRVTTAALIAEVVGNYSVTSLAFGDEKDAREVLARLQRFPDITAGALYDGRGALFASWSRDAAAVTWPTEVDVSRSVRTLAGEVIDIRRTIDYDGETWGAIHLRATTGTLAAELREYVVTLGAIALALVLLAGLASHLIGRVISKPIVDLTEVARRIAADREASVKVPRGSGGELTALASALDVMLTRLAARDRALRLSLGTLRAVIDASPLGIIGVDSRRVVTLWNRGAVRLFGVEEDSAVGKPIADVAPAPSLQALWEQSTAPGGIAGVEVHLPRGDDGVELVCSAAPLNGPDGEPLGAVVVVVDDTERRLAAQALAERATQLQRAQKMEVVGRLAGGVAHDFNNLLTVVITSCQLLARRVDERAQLHVRNVLDAAERGSALARRLLAFSRQQAIDRRIVEVRAVITDLERMLRTVMGEHTQVHLELVDTPAGIEIDQGQLEQVLLNLALNARDAMPRGGELRITTRHVSHADAVAAGAPRRLATDWIALTVSDTGHGMNADTSSHVFEPFFTTKSHGTGLGLATALAIVRDAGGDITVDSAPARGSTFTLWLPRAQGTADDGETSTRDTPIAAGRETILLVEDEPVVRALAREILEDAGYAVIEAQDGADGVDRAGDVSGIDLLVTDVVMPRMSGPELAQALTQRRPTLPVLYMSGYVGDALDHLGVEDASSRPLLQKPFTADALLRRVREALDQRTTQRPRRPSQMFTSVS
jgi:two-component system cell cycle sensor histidine kinase/response regulator CckA